MPETTIAAGPLLHRHLEANAQTAAVNEWTVATQYPSVTSENRLIDCSHWTMAEVQSRNLAASLSAICGLLPGICRFKSVGDWVVYQLTAERAVVAGLSGGGEAIEVSGGWAAIVVKGPNSLDILSHITALDLRPDEFPEGACKQGPVFGVNTLVANRGDHYELHACPDSLEFLWDALLDAGRAYDLQPAGIEQM